MSTIFREPRATPECDDPYGALRRPLKVMTLNIDCYRPKHGSWWTRRRVIASAIHAASPDVVAFQCVRADPTLEGGVDQARQIARELPGLYYAHFVAAADLGHGVREGSAFLSRTPLRDPASHRFAAEGDGDGGGGSVVLAASVRRDDFSLRVANCHFSRGASRNARDVDAALAILGRDAEPCLAVGDLDETPDCETVAELERDGWTDLWAALRPHEHGSTFESNRPFVRLDYAWADSRLAPRVRAIDLAAAKPDPWTGARASDHLALVVELA